MPRLRPRPTRSFAYRAMTVVARAGEYISSTDHLDPAQLLAYTNQQCPHVLDPEDRCIEPLRVLAGSIRSSAQLNTLGRSILRRRLRNCLLNRAYLEDAWTRTTHVLNRTIRRPLYVVGLPRTGTTLLYNLLAQDPNCRPLMFWESCFPVRVHEGRSRESVKSRQRVAVRAIRRFERLSPALAAAHKVNPLGPEECTWLLEN